MKTLLAAAAALLVASPSASLAQITGQVSVERSAFEDAFAASARFSPGQRLLIRVDGSIDANHRYWQDRECSWFGLKCNYVNREASNLMGVDRLPLLLVLEPPGKLAAPAHTYQAEWFNIPTAGVSHLLIAATGRYDVRIGAAGADESVEAFSADATLRAMVADKFDASTPVQRGQCHNRPPVCSSGVYKVTVDVDNTERLALLRKLLEKPRGASEITNRRVMDPLFVQDARVKAGIADALLTHARKFHAASNEEARRDYLRILSFASALDPSSTPILNEITSTYLALGEFAAAAAGAKTAYETAKATFDKETPPRKASVIADLSRALSNRASIWAQERAGVVGADLMIAVNLYRESAGYCMAEAPKAITPADKTRLYACAKDRLVDAGRTLAKLRTRENLILAEQLLNEAQNAARLAVDAS